MWSDSPWDGGLAWQRALADAMHHWTEQVGGAARVPANLDQHLVHEPHANVLVAAGFTIVGEFRFAMPYEWSVTLARS